MRVVGMNKTFVILGMTEAVNITNDDNISDIFITCSRLGQIL